MCKKEMSKLSKSILRMRSATKRDLRNAFDCALCGHPLEFKTKSAKRWWRKWVVVSCALLFCAGCTTTKLYVPNRDLAALHPGECYTNQTQGLEYVIGADLLQDLIIKAQGAK